MRNKFNKKKCLLIVAAGLFLASSVYLTIQTVATGAEMAKLESRQEELLGKKRELENELVKSLSVNRLEEKSVELGFIKPIDINIIYLSGNEVVAKLP